MKILFSNRLFTFYFIFSLFTVYRIMAGTRDVSPRAQARSHGGAFWGRAPPLKLSAPPAKNSEINPIIVTLKAYFLVAYLTLHNTIK